MNRKVHYFPAQSIRIATEETTVLGKQRYTASVADDPASPLGWGDTRMEAIVHLRDKLIELGEIEPKKD